MHEHALLRYAVLRCALPRGQLLHTGAEPEDYYRLKCHQRKIYQNV